MIDPEPSTERRVHVYPMNDAKDHIQRGEYCHCAPQVRRQPDGVVVVVHNAYDGREFFESADAWRALRVACCDCGLIHTLAFAIEDNGNLGMAVRREKRATSAHRRAGRFKGLRLPKVRTQK